MIDKEARKKTAELIRHLVSGQISNYQFEDTIPASSDLAISEVFQHGAWMLYSDFPEYKLIKKNRIPDNNRPEIAKWILFLQTDEEYKWPKYPPFHPFLYLVANLLTFGFVSKQSFKKWKTAGDFDVWPFISREDYKKANSNPTYLSGKS